MTDYLDELLNAGRVLDLAVDPDASRRTVQSKARMVGLLIPLANASCLWKTFGMAEAYLNNALHFNRNLLTGKMRSILDRVRERRHDFPDKLQYLSFAPQDYTIYHHDQPQARVVALHTKPERSWFLLLSKYHPVLGESYGRMRVMGAVESDQPGRNPIHPVMIRTTWRALTNQHVIKRLKEELEEWAS